ncbi:MAG TPA: hypothetical protein VF870_16005 [Ignavibacteriaceae bacterium]
MKDFILFLTTFGLLTFGFGCSSGKYASSENEYTIDKESISSSQLYKLLDVSVRNVSIETEETKFLVEKVCEVNDSSVTIISAPDYEEYEKAVEKFKEDYFNGKVTSDDYPKRKPADTLIIAISAIQSLNYSISNPNQYSENDPEFTVPVTGLEFDFRKDEYTVGFFMQMQINFYRPIIEANTSFNSSKENIWISSSALYTMGYSFIAMMIVKTIKGEPINGAINELAMVKVPGPNSSNDLLSFLIFLPLLLTNAEHHILIINPITPEGTNLLGLSIFAEFRTDIYAPDWIVYSPGYGIQLEFVRGKNEVKDSYYSMYLQTGLEYPYNFQFNNFQKPKLFAGLKFSF